METCLAFLLSPSQAGCKEEGKVQRFQADVT